MNNGITISDLPLVTTPVAGDVIPLVNEEETKKITLEQIKNYANKDLSLLTVQKVDSVDEVVAENIIYLVPAEGEEDNVYDEYMLIDGVPEVIGSQGGGVAETDYVFLHRSDFIDDTAMCTKAIEYITSGRRVALVLPLEALNVLYPTWGSCYYHWVLYQRNKLDAGATSGTIQFDGGRILDMGFDGSEQGQPYYIAPRYNLVITNGSFGSFTSVSNYFKVGVRYNSFILLTTNTRSYTPTSNYHPATKKYVDDAVANAGGASTATDVSFDNTGTNLASTNVQEVVLELNNIIGDIGDVLATLTTPTGGV